MGTMGDIVDKTTAWTGFADYVEALGSAPTGGGENADFEAMIEAALAKEAAAHHEKEPICELPVQFEPIDIVTASENDSLLVRAFISSVPPPSERPQRRYRLSCGLLIQVRHANLRMAYRNIYAGVTLAEKELAANSMFFTLIKNMSHQEDQSVLEFYSGEGVLHELALELVSKKMNLSKKVAKILEAEPLPLRDVHTGLLQFRAPFIAALDEYFHRVEKPPEAREAMGTGALFPEMDSLMALKREECEGCHLMRVLYCANCGGLRTKEASKVLPARIPREDMPFDILMVLHYQENWNRSTGAHASALLEEGVLTVIHWDQLEKGGERKSVLGHIDPQKDILLFPGPQAIRIGDCGLWSSSSSSPSDKTRGINKPRLVVLEANWSYAKSMAGWLTEQIPALRSVCLANVTGTYWRFQEVGASALSTIEALYHAACQAQATSSDCGSGATVAGAEASFHRLLLLFEYQRKRMLAAKEKEGKGIPRGLVPAGSGIHDWGPYLTKFE